MIQKIGNSVQGYRCLTASCRSLNHHDPVFGIADDLILLFLNRPDDIFELYFSVASKLCSENFVVYLDIAFKFIEHLAFTDLVLPF